MPSFVTGERAALKKLADCDENVELVYVRALLSGFQIYTSVDWLLTRHRIFKSFAVQTGDSAHTAVVSVAEFSSHTNDGTLSGSPKAKDYGSTIRKAFAMFEADSLQPKLTPFGVIMVGNPNWFSSASRPCLLVPDGDYDTHYVKLVVNIDLRRLGCGERTALSYKPASQLSRDKFYRVTDIQPTKDAPFEQVVLGLCQLIQRSLALLSLFNANCADGLLCDSTATGLQRFYTEFGPFDDVEVDTEHSCDPKLFLKILRYIDSLKQKLCLLGYQARSGREPDGLPAQLKQFQKAQGLTVTRIFDRETIDRIEALYTKVPVQATAVMSSTVNVLRSKLEDITGLPTGLSRREPLSRTGTELGQTAGSPESEPTLDHYFSLALKTVERTTKKHQSRKKQDKHNDGMLSLNRIASATNASAFFDPALERPFKSRLMSSESGAEERARSLSRKHYGSRRSFSATPAPAWAESIEEEGQHTQTRAGSSRGLRGLKASTSRTIGGIVEKGRSVTKNMKQLASNIKDGQLGSDILQANDAHSSAHTADDYDDQASNQSYALSARHSDIFKRTASVHRRAVSLDSIRHDEFGVLPLMPPKGPLPRGPPPGSTTHTGLSPPMSVLSITGTMSDEELSPVRVGKNEDPPPDKAPPSTSPIRNAQGDNGERIPTSVKTRADMTRAALALHSDAGSLNLPTIPPETRQATVLLEACIKKMREVDVSGQRSVVTLHQKLEDHQGQIESIENEALRAHYAVGVLEARLIETEEAVAGFLKRLAEVEDKLSHR
ncbi:hypothetical protein HDU85_006942 [Gaertneriomyces sp. JEL0708]|nr:hypothetical protein HDU85_006942 [Gaertneriomyces sp. JEL0708]